jgi:large subunit ribosomal protein L23
MADIANLSIIPLTRTSFAPDSKEIAFKTIPSASKFQIKHFIESFYNLQVQKVRTLNVKGKTKNRGGTLIAKPNYKKAYVTLKKPVSFTNDLFPFHSSVNAVNDNHKNKNKMAANQF